tara:strand:- start:9328 stop:9489 length:162 start_codon:yes stop_codon:yes gene_type:complete
MIEVNNKKNISFYKLKKTKTPEIDLYEESVANRRIKESKGKVSYINSSIVLYK